MKSNLKRKMAKLIPSSMKPFAKRIYRFAFESNAREIRINKKLLLSAGVLRSTISYNKYGGYCVPLSSQHRPAAKKILANDVHEPKTIQFITTHCKSGDIVHAGTFFGDFLPALSSRSARGAIVWAFEPNRENYRCARITVEINVLENVRLMNVGLGAERAKLRIQTEDEAGVSLGGASQIITKSSKGIKSEEVEIVSVDETVPADRNISVVQLDVEGYEKEALIGALHSIRRCSPIIIIEVLPSSELTESDWFSQNILALGYRKTEVVHGNHVYQRH